MSGGLTTSLFYCETTGRAVWLSHRRDSGRGDGSALWAKILWEETQFCGLEAGLFCRLSFEEMSTGYFIFGNVDGNVACCSSERLTSARWRAGRDFDRLSGWGLACAVGGCVWPVPG